MPNMLEPLGLDAVEESVYLALVRQPRMPMPELSARLGLSSQALMRGLLALEGKGLIARSIEDGSTYLPSAPDLAIEALVHAREEELKRLQLVGRQLASEYRLSSQTRSPVELAEVLVGPDAVFQRADQIDLGVRSEILMVDRPPYRSPEGPRFDENEVRHLEAGMVYRTIYDRSVLEIPGYLDMILRYVEAGEQARVIMDAPFKLNIYDRTVCLMSLNTAERDRVESAIVVHESPLLSAVILAFERLWASAQPLTQAKPAARSQAMDDRTRRVLTMLAAGMKDAAVARQLGITERTVRRHVDIIMTELRAATRFQAGTEAIRQGLV